MANETTNHVTPGVVESTRNLRLADLVAAAPVPTMLVDYRRVIAYFETLRDSGVKDLRQYLNENPLEIRHLIGLLGPTVSNQSWYELYGSVRSESRRPLTDFVELEGEQPPVIQSLIAQFDAAWNGIPTVVCEHQAPSGHEELLWVRSSWRVLITDEGLDFANVIISDVDISSLKAAQEILRETILAKDRFLAAISHEIRTPLTPIVGLVAELERTWRSLPPEEVSEILRMVRGQADELSAIVDDLLVATRAEIGAVNINLAPHTLEEAIQHTGPFTPADVDIDFQEQALMDVGRVRQIIRNLLTNAHRYGGDTVQIRSRRNEDRVEIVVRDNGPGVPPGLESDLFEAFGNTAAIASVPESIGLGLFVSKTLAVLMKGDLEYRRSEGWTEFVLTLRKPPG